MVSICPTITAFSNEEYDTQIKNVEGFAEHIHIDLMDGIFAPTKSPELKYVWWPEHLKADIHLMYQNPMEHIDELIRLRPNMVIIHNEADVHHMHFAAILHKHDIKAGLAVLADTPIENAYQIMHSFDQVLIFSGNLGHHGGEADLGLLTKAKKTKLHHPECSLAWDGGINAENAIKLVESGIKTLNVGGYIQKSMSPYDAYVNILKSIK